MGFCDKNLGLPPPARLFTVNSDCFYLTLLVKAIRGTSLMRWIPRTVLHAEVSEVWRDLEVPSLGEAVPSRGR